VRSRDIDPLPAAVALELVHKESLIHDDIIDRDSLRRGKAAFHKTYDYETALLSVDFTLSIILDLIARYQDSRITQELALAISRMCEGALEELTAYKDQQPLSIDTYVNIVSKKTASLFEASATIGAIIGGAQENETKSLSNYGRLLGIAYQIQDDMSDLGKKSAVNLLNLLNTRLEKNDFLSKLSKEYVTKAKRQLEILKASEAKNLLTELSDFIISGSIDRT
jgi:octaprenyl-diphosphate synthase